MVWRMTKAVVEPRSLGYVVHTVVSYTKYMHVLF